MNTDRGTVGFEAPGAGTWSWDRTHFPLPMTPLYGEAHTLAVDAFRGAFADYGIPVQTYAERCVRGIPYTRVLPLIGAESNRKPPPAPVLRLVMRLHPEFRRRATRAGQVLETRPWRDALPRWRSVDGPRWVAANLAFQDEDLAALDGEALAEHLGRVHRHLVDALTAHFALHVPDLVPIGLLLLAANDAGIPSDAVLGALAGSSPTTRTPDRDRSWQLVTGYDLDARAVCEVAGVLGGDPPLPGAGQVGGNGPGREGLVAHLADAGARRQLESLFDDAVAASALREENGPVLVQWPAGLVRRALLEIGRRVGVDDGSIVEATMDEALALLSGRPGPSAAELRERTEARRRVATEAPPTIGTPEPPPPVDLMPSAQRRITRAILAAKTALFDRAVSGTLQGVGVGTTAYKGTARVARTVDDVLFDMSPGDVLVTTMTTPAFNAVIQLAGAVVTTEGGPLSHAAITCREFGVPAVIGVEGALAAVATGDLVEVDPVAGRIRVIEAAA